MPKQTRSVERVESARRKCNNNITRICPNTNNRTQFGKFMGHFTIFVDNEELIKYVD